MITERMKEAVHDAVKKLVEKGNEIYKEQPLELKRRHLHMLCDEILSDAVESIIQDAEREIRKDEIGRIKIELSEYAHSSIDLELSTTGEYRQRE